MKCKDCVYYTGTQCHGHGEFWGECNLLKMAYKEIERNTKCLYIKENWSLVCDENTDCKIMKKFEWEIRK